MKQRVIRDENGEFRYVDDTRIEEERMRDYRKGTAKALLRVVRAEQSAGIVRPGDTAGFVARMQKQAKGA